MKGNIGVASTDHGVRIAALERGTENRKASSRHRSRHNRIEDLGYVATVYRNGYCSRGDCHTE
ncbi:MAG: hypothetical protein OXI24_12920 [Candidatus Poribacteria bacterium]|nr:hypothetical protein [Candidatus Poribacteria bacterium]